MLSEGVYVCPNSIRHIPKAGYGSVRGRRFLFDLCTLRNQVLLCQKIVQRERRNTPAPCTTWYISYLDWVCCEAWGHNKTYALA